VLKQVDYDYQRMQYNTVVSGAMKMINALEDFKALAARATGGTDRRLWHFAALPVPGHAAHVAHSLWSQLGYAAPGRSARCPLAQVDPEAALVQDEIELMLQVNGKLRGSIHVPAQADKAEIETLGACGAAPGPFRLQDHLHQPGRRRFAGQRTSLGFFESPCNLLPPSSPPISKKACARFTPCMVMSPC
jgi:leucyl-tRNA synthetase